MQPFCHLSFAVGRKTVDWDITLVHNNANPVAPYSHLPPCSPAQSPPGWTPGLFPPLWPPSHCCDSAKPCCQQNKRSLISIRWMDKSPERQTTSSWQYSQWQNAKQSASLQDSHLHLCAPAKKRLPESRIPFLSSCIPRRFYGLPCVSDCPGN